jgi:solute carrier family 25 iron transporter 28/37
MQSQRFAGETLREFRKTPLRMFRGVSASLSGCLPAHAAYFSIYEAGKEHLGANRPGHHPFAAGLAGAMASVAHDCIMTPLDVMKQRMQLGYHTGLVDCARTVVGEEGACALIRSVPTTLVMNIPYAAVMVASNESMKQVLNPSGEQVRRIAGERMGGGHGGERRGWREPRERVG